MSLGLCELLSGAAVELVGVEEQDDGGMRLYITHRARGLYALIYDEGAKAEAREAWNGGSRILIPTPPLECVFSESRP